MKISLTEELTSGALVSSTAGYYSTITFVSVPRLFVPEDILNPTGYYIHWVVPLLTISFDLTCHQMRNDCFLYQSLVDILLLAIQAPRYFTSTFVRYRLIG